MLLSLIVHVRGNKCYCDALTWVKITHGNIKYSSHFHLNICFLWSRVHRRASVLHYLLFIYLFICLFEKGQCTLVKLIPVGKVILCIHKSIHKEQLLQRRTSPDKESKVSGSWAESLRHECHQWHEIESGQRNILLQLDLTSHLWLYLKLDRQTLTLLR